MKVTGERKEVAKRLAELTGTEARYMGAPSFAYKAGDFIIGRDGTVTADEDADPAPLLKLAEEGLLEGCERVQEAASEESADESSGRDRGAKEAATEEQEAAAEGDVEEDADAMDNPDSLTISLSLTGHTATSVRNLVAMAYSRGSLISKATGGRFSATAELVETLRDCTSIEDIRNRLTNGEEGALEGLELENDRISFTGFPLSDDPEKSKAFTQLAAQMGKLARKQKRTAAKDVDGSNERYAFRIWLIALGMKGDEFKTARRVLLAPLTGSKAFRTKEAEERFKAAQKTKRIAAKQAGAFAQPIPEPAEG